MADHGQAREPRGRGDQDHRRALLRHRVSGVRLRHGIRRGRRQGAHPDQQARPPPRARGGGGGVPEPRGGSPPRAVLRPGARLRLLPLRPGAPPVPQVGTAFRLLSFFSKLTCGFHFTTA